MAGAIAPRWPFMARINPTLHAGRAGNIAGKQWLIGIETVEREMGYYELCIVVRSMVGRYPLRFIASYLGMPIANVEEIVSDADRVLLR